MASETEYNGIILTTVGTTMGMGATFVFAPGGDIAPVLGAWGVMLKAIADKSGHKKNAEFWGKVAATVAASGALMVTGVKIMTGVLFYSGVGIPAAVTINSLINGFYTWRLGNAAVKLFNNPGVKLNDAAIIARILVGAFRPIPTVAEARHFWDMVRHLFDS